MGISDSDWGLRAHTTNTTQYGLELIVISAVLYWSMYCESIHHHYVGNVYNRCICIAYYRQKSKERMDIHIHQKDVGWMMKMTATAMMCAKQAFSKMHRCIFPVCFIAPASSHNFRICWTVSCNHIHEYQTHNAAQHAPSVNWILFCSFDRMRMCNPCVLHAS